MDLNQLLNLAGNIPFAILVACWFMFRLETALTSLIAKEERELELLTELLAELKAKRN